MFPNVNKYIDDEVECSAGDICQTRCTLCLKDGVSFLVSGEEQNKKIKKIVAYI